MAFPWPLDLWNNWSIHILVLLSLTLQIALFVFAGIRRRGAHYVVQFLLWLAYQLSDYTATYALGHLSIKGAHPTVAFWALFLLLHLGGPDNITAYSLEDSKLWKRHLLYAILQVLGAAYIFYEHVARLAASLQLASMLMFAVGAVKYGEKTLALKRSNLDTIRGCVKKQPPAMHRHFHPQDNVVKGNVLDEESLVRRAHSLFHICKRAIVDYPVTEDDSLGQDTTNAIGQEVRFWILMETEISLMYDMLYTKAAVVHTWFGYSVRLVSPLAILASLLLFRLTHKDTHHEADLVITYILYGGALFMETTSLLNALGSSWTFAFLSTTRCRWLQKAALCKERWDRLRRWVVCVHHLVRVGGGSQYTSRKWSRTIGQYNMLHLCTGASDRWNRGHYSWNTKLPKHVKECISHHMEIVFKQGAAINSLGMLRNRWGEEALVRYGLFEGILKRSLGVEFQECIIIWHIGTDIFLAMSERNEQASPDVKAIKVISNYMMFLLVEQPDMLPGLSQNRLYQRTCENLVNTRQSNSRVTGREELAKIIYHENTCKRFSQDSPRLPYAAKLAKELLKLEADGRADSVKLILDVWTDILVYASNKCSRKAHAEKLSSGGELTTILWLMAEHFYQIYLETLSKVPENNSSGEGISQVAR